MNVADERQTRFNARVLKQLAYGPQTVNHIAERLGAPTKWVQYALGLLCGAAGGAEEIPGTRPRKYCLRGRAPKIERKPVEQSAEAPFKVAGPMLIRGYVYPGRRFAR